MTGSPTETLAGRVAVITGAAGGIGSALVREALARGMRVVAADRDASALDQFVATLPEGSEVLPMTVDVGDFDSVQRVEHVAREEFGPVWLVVSNAGAMAHGRSWKLSAQEWDDVVTSNLGGAINGVRAFLPGMIERDSGHIVNVASIAGLLPAGGRANYTASKFGIVGLSEAVGFDLQGERSSVGISVLCPGPVRTQRWHGRKIPEGFEPIEADALASVVLDAVLRKQFWIVPQRDVFAPALTRRLEGILSQSNPDRSSVDPIIGFGNPEAL